MSDAAVSAYLFAPALKTQILCNFKAIIPDQKMNYNRHFPADHCLSQRLGYNAWPHGRLYDNWSGSVLQDNEDYRDKTGC